MDMLSNEFNKCIFSNATKYNQQFWNPLVSWVNKWKNNDEAQGEKFPGSSTVFVFLTDGRHLFKMLFLTSIFSAVILYQPISFIPWYLIFPLICGLWGVIFQLTEKALTKS